MSAQKIINAFSYLLKNDPKLTIENEESIRKLCQGKNNLDEVVGAIGEWCQERGVYDKLLELNKTKLPAKGDFVCLEQPNATVAEVEQSLIANTLASLNRNEKQNDDPNKNDDSNQPKAGTKKP